MSQKKTHCGSLMHTTHQESECHGSVSNSIMDFPALFAAPPPLCIVQLRILPSLTELMVTLQKAGLPFPDHLPSLVECLASSDTSVPHDC